MMLDESSYGQKLGMVFVMKEDTSEDYRARMLRVLVHIQ
jgi:hypothetical protein